MLAGQSIGTGDSLLISLVGMAVVMLELGLLCAFVVVLSKVVAKLLGKSGEKKAEAPADVAAPTADAVAVTEEEIAAIAVTVCEQSGLGPDQFRIVSITSHS